MSRKDPYEWSRQEYAAYSAYEQARSGNVPLDTILKNLGHYDQGVVDSYNSKPNEKVKRNETT